VSVVSETFVALPPAPTPSPSPDPLPIPDPTTAPDSDLPSLPELPLAGASGGQTRAVATSTAPVAAAPEAVRPGATGMRPVTLELRRTRGRRPHILIVTARPQPGARVTRFVLERVRRGGRRQVVARKNDKVRGGVSRVRFSVRSASRARYRVSVASGPSHATVVPLGTATLRTPKGPARR
jgi:hypothetical protein